MYFRSGIEYEQQFGVRPFEIRQSYQDWPLFREKDFQTLKQILLWIPFLKIGLETINFLYFWFKTIAMIRTRVQKKGKGSQGRSFFQALA